MTRMIGTLRETDLHAALKQYYARPGDVVEAAVEGYVVDILRGEHIMEIQTRNFAALKRKLPRLLETHAVTLIHPIAAAKWIIRLDARTRQPIGRRKSPRRGQLSELFVELVSWPELILHPRFTLEVVLIDEEEIRCPVRSRRRAWRVCNRRLVQVRERVTFAAPADFGGFIPSTLAQPFTSRELAQASQQPDWLAHKMTYCLRRMGVIEAIGFRQRAKLYLQKSLLQGANSL